MVLLLFFNSLYGHPLGRSNVVPWSWIVHGKNLCKDVGMLSCMKLPWGVDGGRLDIMWKRFCTGFFHRWCDLMRFIVYFFMYQRMKKTQMQVTQCHELGFWCWCPLGLCEFGCVYWCVYLSILVIHLFNKHVLSVCLNAVMHEEVVITYWLFLRFHYFKRTTKSLGLGIDTSTSIFIQVFADFFKVGSTGPTLFGTNSSCFFGDFFSRKKFQNLYVKHRWSSECIDYSAG